MKLEEWKGKTGIITGRKNECNYEMYVRNEREREGSTEMTQSKYTIRENTEM